MKRPVCPETGPETGLVITERQGVEIDNRPKCRGVWLDRGELDKIVERSVVMPAPSATPIHAAVEQDGHLRQQGYHHHDEPQHGYKRRKSRLGELFD